MKVVIRILIPLSFVFILALSSNVPPIYADDDDLLLFSIVSLNKNKQVKCENPPQIYTTCIRYYASESPGVIAISPKESFFAKSTRDMISIYNIIDGSAINFTVSAVSGYPGSFYFDFLSENELLINDRESLVVWDFVNDAKSRPFNLFLDWRPFTVSYSSDKSVGLFRLEDNKYVAINFKTKTIVKVLNEVDYGILFPDGDQILLQRSTGTVELLVLSTNTIQQYPSSEVLLDMCMKISNDENFLITKSYASDFYLNLNIYDLTTMKKLYYLEFDTQNNYYDILDFKFSKDSKKIYVLYEDYPNNYFLILDSQTGEVQNKIFSDAIAFDMYHNEDKIIIGYKCNDSSSTDKITDIDLNILTSFNFPHSGLQACQLSNDNQYLGCRDGGRGVYLVGACDGIIYGYSGDVRGDPSNESLQGPIAVDGPNKKVAFSSSLIGSSSYLRIYDFKNNKISFEKYFSIPITGLLFTEDGKLIYSISDGNTGECGIFNLKTGNQTVLLSGKPVTTVLIDQKDIYLGIITENYSSGGTLDIFSLTNNNNIYSYIGNKYIKSAVFSKSDKQIYIAETQDYRDSEHSNLSVIDFINDNKTYVSKFKYMINPYLINDDLLIVYQDGGDYGNNMYLFDNDTNKVIRTIYPSSYQHLSILGILSDSNKLLLGVGTPFDTLALMTLPYSISRDDSQFKVENITFTPDENNLINIKFNKPLAEENCYKNTDGTILFDNTQANILEDHGCYTDSIWIKPSIEIEYGKTYNVKIEPIFTSINGQLNEKYEANIKAY